MSGLLQRLARQVVGPAPLMARARITPRFAPPGDAVPAGDAAGAPAGNAPQGAASTKPPTQTAAPDTRRIGATTTYAARAADATADGARVAHEADVPGRDGMRDTPYTVLDAPRQFAAPPRLLPPRTATPPAAAMDAEPAHTPAHTPAAAAGTTASFLSPTTDTHAMPAPLFAAGTDSHPPRGAFAGTISGPGQQPPNRQSLSARLPDTRSPDSAPNEVHVHIGRIEVTALQDAPAAKPRTRGRQPMSLDEYLARRQGERR